MRRNTLIAIISLCLGSSAFGLASLVMLGNPTINVQTTADRQNGVTISHQTLNVTAKAGQNTQLQVRASGNLISGANSIPINTLFIQITAPIVGTEIQTSTVNQTLFLQKFNSSISNQPLTIKYRLATSAALSGPAGAYTTVLTFTITQI